MINYIKYYKTFIRYGLGYEGDAWFANNYILPFKKKGFYIDIGCYHPLKYSQTYKLYKLGWSGINLDISKESIDLFKLFRSKDKNLNIGISNKAGFENFYFTKKISTTNSLNNKYLKESINFKKKFTLTSGKKSPVYVDCRKLISFPKEREIIINEIIIFLIKVFQATDMVWRRIIASRTNCICSHFSLLRSIQTC